MSPGLWLLLAAVAALIGLDKSLLPGVGILGIGVLAAAIPARTAGGVTLALVIIADWAAISAYRKDVDWRALRALLPTVIGGVVLGAAFLLFADDTVTRRTIGVIIVAVVTVNIVRMLRERAGTTPAETRRSRPKSLFFGSLAGFATMVANAAGPVTSMYFLSEGFAVVRFLGTTAWLFLILNLVKLPFSLGLGMLTVGSLGPVLCMVPVIVVSVFLGRRLATRIDRGIFTVAVTVLSGIAGVVLLV